MAEKSWTCHFKLYYRSIENLKIPKFLSTEYVFYVVFDKIVAKNCFRVRPNRRLNKFFGTFSRKNKFYAQLW